jgi:NAD+ kinase
VIAAEMLEFLEEHGVSAWAASGWDNEDVIQRMLPTEVLITLGGDGSMLRAARLALGHEAAILGVNQGRLGFLAEVQPAEWRERFEQLLYGQYWLEERLMVRAHCWRQDELIGTYHALNEVAVNRGGLARVVRLTTFINDSYLTTYTADGMILSTPTGSTAYALAAGGPILPPELKNILLIPVAPHLSLERALVLSEGDTVKLTVETDHQGILTVDGQFDIELADGDIIEVAASSQVSRFLRLQDRTYFYKTLMQRLGWPQKR